MKKYDVMIAVLEKEKLIIPIAVVGNHVKLYAYRKELFNILLKIHLSFGHAVEKAWNTN